MWVNRRADTVRKHDWELCTHETGERAPMTEVGASLATIDYHWIAENSDRSRSMKILKSFFPIWKDSST
jgi:hypothetical protein